jgi:hypothetical protein
MVNRQRPHFIQFGPPIPLVPFGHFVQESHDPEFYDMAWYLVGPTIEKNLEKHYTRPHQLYCIAFIEGMRMAIKGIEDRNESRREELLPSSGSTSQEPADSLSRVANQGGVEYITFPGEICL